MAAPGGNASRCLLQHSSAATKSLDNLKVPPLELCRRRVTSSPLLRPLCSPFPPLEPVLCPFLCTTIGLPAVALGNVRIFRFACVLLFLWRHFSPYLGWFAVASCSKMPGHGYAVFMIRQGKRDGVRKKQWLHNIGRKNFVPTKNSICSKRPPMLHFFFSSGLLITVSATVICTLHKNRVVFSMLNILLELRHLTRQLLFSRKCSTIDYASCCEQLRAKTQPLDSAFRDC